MEKLSPKERDAYKSAYDSFRSYHHQKMGELRRQIERSIVVAILDSKTGDVAIDNFTRNAVLDIMTRNTLEDCTYDILDKWLTSGGIEDLESACNSYERLTGKNPNTLYDYLILRDSYNKI